ncbi:MAG: hypothetical protein AAB581_01005 [Patescibacteria group bacterium]
MKLFICCSKHVYEKIPPIQEQLERMGHVITLPNSYEEPMKEEDMKKVSPEAHQKWKADMIHRQKAKVLDNDAVFVPNLEKYGQPNYIGGATFLEIFCAFDAGKKIFLYNPVPDNILRDELLGMNPTIINGDLTKIR